MGPETAATEPARATATEPARGGGAVVAVTENPATERGAGRDEGARVVRLRGDAGVVATRDGKDFRSGRYIVNENLPEGYPPPTPPGTIELKDYPTVRRAEYRGGQGSSTFRTSTGFWPLFAHIKKRNIAMTSPVEMDYRGLQLAAADEIASGDQVAVRNAEWTMSFLYRTPELGPKGTDGKIEVLDTEPLTVIAVGVVGSPSERTVNDGVDKLRAFFESQDEWEPAGDLRGLFYNGPDIPESRKWSEIQVPVRRATRGSEPPSK